MLVRAFKNAFNSYNNFTLKNPLMGYALTSGVCLGVGNLTCQLLMYKTKKRIDVYQLIQYSSYGLLLSGPLLRYWWYALELKVFKNPNSFLRPLKMMLVDQSTTPYLLNSMFFLYLGLTNGQSIHESIQKTKKALFPIVFESYKVWPVAMLINFYIIPLHNRILFSNIIGVMWSIYLTYMVNKNNY